MGDNRILKTRRRRLIRQITLWVGFGLLVYCLIFISRTPTLLYFPSSSETPWPGYGSSSTTRRLSEETLNNLSLTEEQCRATFPGLTDQIDEVVARGPFKVKHSGDFGPLQGRIKDGQIFILNAQRKSDLSREMVNSRTAALHQLHRAVITSPTPLPPTIFTLNFRDEPFGAAFTYSRQASAALRSKNPSARSFLMPHFSFWAWDLPFINSMRHASHAIDHLESTTPFSSKIPKAIWRGTTWFNSVHSPQLRGKLIQTTKNKPWADVQALEWTTTTTANRRGGGDMSSTRNATNALPISAFCRYRYVIHTEGVTYSGRFQFLQMCASVVLTPPIHWLQHTTHLIRPLFSSTLTKKWTPSPRTLQTWPRQYPPEEANIVFVSPDWSDLEETVAWLEGHPGVAEGIGRRQRELFVGGGYFSPAAEVCYWRELVRAWAGVAVVDREGGEGEGEGGGGGGGKGKHWADEEGVPYEMFSLTNGD